MQIKFPLSSSLACWVLYLMIVTNIWVKSSWNVVAHDDAWEGKWRGNWRMEWVATTLHTTSEHGVSSITTADAHTSAASSRLNWRPRRFKWTRPFRQKTKSGSARVPSRFKRSLWHCHVLPDKWSYRLTVSMCNKVRIFLKYMKII